MNAITEKTVSLSTEEQRKAGGIWLKSCRLKVDLSQKQLAEKVGVDYHTFISQLENGRGRIPPGRYEDWAEAFGIPAEKFVFNLMRYYDPVTFRILFPNLRKSESIY